MQIDFYGVGFGLFLILAVCSCHLRDSKSYEEDLAKIKQLHEMDWTASKAHDIETLRTLWTEDAVLLPPGLEPIIGDEAIWAFMQAQLPEMMSYDILDYIHDFEEIEILGDWAYEWGTFNGEYRRKGSDEILHERSRLFRILKRQSDGSWKVARAIWHALPATNGEEESS